MNAEENTLKEYNGKQYTTYEALQRQRRLETTLRAQRQEIKLLEQGHASQDDILAAKARYYKTSNEYAEFSKEMGLPQQRERITVDGLGTIKNTQKSSENIPSSSGGNSSRSVEKSGESGIIESDSNQYVGQPIELTDNQHIREWYVANVQNIPNQIDPNMSLEAQAKAAFDYRNLLKRKARVAMSDEETADFLEKSRPIPTFEELLKDKMERKEMTREEAIRDILKTASKTNKDVDKEFGL